VREDDSAGDDRGPGPGPCGSPDHEARAAGRIGDAHVYRGTNDKDANGEGDDSSIGHSDDEAISNHDDDSKAHGKSDTSSDRDGDGWQSR
jgi:hypothetical protein